eukprot:TRINITY_DN22508_c0_g1_i1.p1 TRINITY_DN22508_c0_g1~~TRINITY_DN22508_c0_g1_i1.p1  ORF type:complete len:225 (-),score=41.97 TRINITY_DN22508_c0_g1_i1:214-888(-)
MSFPHGATVPKAARSGVGSLAFWKEAVKKEDLTASLVPEEVYDSQASYGVARSIQSLEDIIEGRNAIRRKQGELHDDVPRWLVASLARRAEHFDKSELLAATAMPMMHRYAEDVLPEGTLTARARTPRSLPPMAPRPATSGAVLRGSRASAKAPEVASVAGTLRPVYKLSRTPRLGTPRCASDHGGRIVQDVDARCPEAKKGSKILATALGNRSSCPFERTRYA